MRAGRSTRRRIERAVTLLPHPDSPTTASVRPRRTVRLTPSTALTTPSSSSKCVLRSRTSSKGIAIGKLLLVGIRGVAETVADEVHGEYDDHDRKARGQQPGGGGDR